MVIWATLLSACDDAKVAGWVIPCNRTPESGPLRGAVSRVTVSYMGQRMCERCQDVMLIEWQQLTLDDSHIVEYRAAKCLCGVRLLTAAVVVTEDA